MENRQNGAVSAMQEGPMTTPAPSAEERRLREALETRYKTEVLLAEAGGMLSGLVSRLGDDPHVQRHVRSLAAKILDHVGTLAAPRPGEEHGE